MKTASGTTLISNGQLIDGSGRAPIPNAALVIRDGRIAFAGPAAEAPPVPEETARIDARGGTIMPGLVEAHFHATYFNIAALEDLDIKYPVEYVSLLASVNTRLALECGYTAARSGGCLFNVDVWLKKAIEEDLDRRAAPLHERPRDLLRGRLDGLEPGVSEDRHGGPRLHHQRRRRTRAARCASLVKDGIEWVKTYPTGDAASPDINDHHTLCMTFEEMHAVVATAHNHKLKVTGHCRATQGIKNALRAGYDTIEHGTFMDDEAMELLLERDVPCIPALYFEKASIELRAGVWAAAGGHRWPPGDARGRRRKRAAHPARGRAAGHGRRLRIRLEPAWRLRARADVLREGRGAHAAGGDHLRHENRRGDHGPRRVNSARWRQGKLADVLVVDGDVAADISLLEDRKRFLAVMQGGIVKAGQLAKPFPTVVKREK